MTLELENRARAWRTDKVEVIRVNESGVPQGSAITTVSYQQPSPVFWVTTETGPWTDPRSSVVLRRLTKPREQTRGWRRHTVVKPPVTKSHSDHHGEGHGPAAGVSHALFRRG
ncbi:hypothetical protein WMY93_010768 [Mugilogobius chulae]|uniref:Uncharacterized protein n=1 Tax=Mugilogobius chulae TaxID=88201 RepID=A0AAW0PC40_9GOBI